LHSHINELERRVTALTETTAGSARAKEIGFTAGHRAAFIAALPVFRKHIDAAKNELARSLAAHAHGTSGDVADPARTFHTADVAYSNSHQHAADAQRHLFATVGNGMRAMSETNWHTPTLTESGQKNLMTGYREHLKHIAANRAVSLPSGVLTSDAPDLSPLSGTSEVGKAALKRAGVEPLEDTVERSQKVAKKSVQEGLQRLQQGKSTGTVTLTQVQRAQRAAQEGAQLKPTTRSSKTAYEGTGISGLTDIHAAAKLHYEYQNPGKSWHESGHDKSAKSVLDYATAHNVGPATTAMDVGKRALERLGLGDMAKHFGAILDQAATAERAVAAGKPEPEGIDPMSAARQVKKELEQGTRSLPAQAKAGKRNGEFNVGGTK
jgi:thymidylate synthase